MKTYISIIVPVYNVEPYIEKCISSIRNQSYQNIQIILVNDGSTDHSGLICDKYAQMDSRIKVVHKVNGGLVSARKAGLKEARGDFVGYVDGDDWIESSYYEQLVSAQEASGADIVAAGHFHDIGNESKKVMNQISNGFYGKDSILPKLIYSGRFFEYGLQPHIYTKLIRKNILYKTQLSVDERICAGEDAAVIYPSVLEAKQILITDICGYHYVQRQGSITKTGNANERERIQILMEYLERIFMQKGVAKIMGPQLVQYKKYFFLLRQIQVLDEQILIPYGGISRHSRVIIYGAGVLGQKIYEYLLNDGFVEIVCWLDQNFRNYRSQGLDVYSPEKIKELKNLYDYVLIANTVESIAYSIQEYLMAMQVPKKKIRWLSESFIHDGSSGCCLSQ